MNQHIEWRLPRSPRSAGRARAFLAEQSREWKLPDDLTETAVLLLSELVTNACRHARVPPGREVRARCLLGSDGVLRVEVSDASEVLPCPRTAGPGDEAGRGLALVAALADAWGAHPRECGVGKTVWFEIGDGVRGRPWCADLEGLEGADDARHDPGPPEGGPRPAATVIATEAAGRDKEEPCPTRRSRPGT